MCTKLITAILCTILITACGKSGGGPEAAAKAPSIPDTQGPPPPPPPPPPTLTTIVVYTASTTSHITTGGQSYTVTSSGSCAIWLGNTYCWDDGWHRYDAQGGLSYFNLLYVSGQWVSGSEGGVDIPDPLENQPVLITQAIIDQLPGNIVEPDGTLSTLVSRTMAAGTQSQVTCTIETSGDVTCPTFTLTP